MIMKTLFTTFLMLFAFSFVSVQAQDREQKHSQTQILRTIPINDICQPVVFMFYDDVQVEEWENNYIKIETTINALNFSETLLNYLIETGRYNIKVTERPEDGAKVLSMPKRELVIMKQNADVEEFLNIQIYIPKGLMWEIIDPRVPFSL